jgi:hypothetical protein
MGARVFSHAFDGVEDVAAVLASIFVGGHGTPPAVAWFATFARVAPSSL